MPFLNGSISLQVYTDSSQTSFPLESVPYIQKSFTSTAVTGVQAETLSIAASSSQTINLNGLTGVTGIYIYSTAADVNVNINGLGNILCKAARPGFMPFSVTSLAIANTSGSVATTVSVVLICG